MSYTKDLDEYTERELMAEIERRSALRKQGLCDYCKQPPTAPACKFFGRHHNHESSYINAGKR